MHNSQNGQPMASEYSSSTRDLVPVPTPSPALLKIDCIGCHFNIGTTTIDSHGTPIVLNTQLPDNPLAGGNFRFVAKGLGTDNMGHNVKGISDPDPTLKTPPGFKGSVPLPPYGVETGPLSWPETQQPTCAGTYGCHGKRTESDEIKAIFGGHHGNINIDSSTPQAGNDVYNSYRFLLGIKGAEVDKWEQTVTSDHHNGYQGDASGSLNTISYFCGECHWHYHDTADVGNSSPWLRHPTDFAFSGVSDYSHSEYKLYVDTNTYSTLAPVAETAPATNSTVNPGSIVMCLSCHRAHASTSFKIMRWNYKSLNLSEALSGCNVCHTSKN